MPNMADIVVKKADGTTDFTFVKLTASPGDGGFAQWAGAGDTPSSRANLRIKTQWNGNRTARQFEASGNFPYAATDLATSVTSVLANWNFRFSGTVPQNMPSPLAADAAAVIANALASTLFKEMTATGYAAT